MSGMLIDTSLKKYLGKWLTSGLNTCLHMFDILADKGAEVEYVSTDHKWKHVDLQQLT